VQSHNSTMATAFAPRSTAVTYRCRCVNSQRVPVACAHRICTLPGDGIGPEIMKVATDLLEKAGSKESVQFEMSERLIGGAAIDAHDNPFPEETEGACKDSDAVLLAAIGGCALYSCQLVLKASCMHACLPAYQRGAKLARLVHNRTEFIAGAAACDWAHHACLRAAQSSHAPQRPAAALQLTRTACARRYKWDSRPAGAKPENGLLSLRASLRAYANLRPCLVLPQLAGASTLKREVVSGVDIMIVRELVGGIYFGEPRVRECRERCAGCSANCRADGTATPDRAVARKRVPASSRASAWRNMLYDWLRRMCTSLSSCPPASCRGTASPAAQCRALTQMRQASGARSTRWLTASPRSSVLRSTRLTSRCIAASACARSTRQTYSRSASCGARCAVLWLTHRIAACRIWVMRLLHGSACGGARGWLRSAPLELAVLGWPVPQAWPAQAAGSNRDATACLWHARPPRRCAGRDEGG
jgi:Isocitrate/isopropylmalate dehydrogenase